MDALLTSILAAQNHEQRDLLNAKFRVYLCQYIGTARVRPDRANLPNGEDGIGDIGTLSDRKGTIQTCNLLRAADRYA